MFTFLVQNPDVIVDTWRVMGVSRVKIERAGELMFRTSDGAGTSGWFNYLNAKWEAGAFNHALIFGEGTYDGKPFPQPIQARCVILLRSGSTEETNRRTYVTVRMDSFVIIEQMAVELVAKTVHPLVGKTADQNFDETLKFVSNFSRTAERNPRGMEDFAARLTNIEPQVRAELIGLCHSTAERYAERKNHPPTGAPLAGQAAG
jgi:hypothetical protein